jgi:hypothetical protein
MLPSIRILYKDRHNILTSVVGQEQIKFDPTEVESQKLSIKNERLFIVTTATIAEVAPKLSGVRPICLQGYRMSYERYTTQLVTAEVRLRPGSFSPSAAQPIDMTDGARLGL